MSLSRVTSRPAENPPLQGLVFFAVQTSNVLCNSQLTSSCYHVTFFCFSQPALRTEPNVKARSCAAAYIRAQLLMHEYRYAAANQHITRTPSPLRVPFSTACNSFLCPRPFGCTTCLPLAHRHQSVHVYLHGVWLRRVSRAGEIWPSRPDCY